MCLINENVRRRKIGVIISSKENVITLSKKKAFAKISNRRI